jgi:hypothetical protein
VDGSIWSDAEAKYQDIPKIRHELAILRVSSRASAFSVYDST